MSERLDLSEKHALVVGVGARGQLAAAQLAAAGVGRIGLIDGASFESKDLRSGPLTFMPDVGTGKADGAAVKLGLINDRVHAEPFPAFLDTANAELILAGSDVVIDCTDNTEAHLIANDACVKLEIALLSGDVDSSGGWWARPAEGQCLRSFLRPATASDSDATPDLTNTETPSQPALASAISSVQTAAALSLLAGEPEPSVRLLQQLNATSLNWSTRELSCSSDCVCRGGSTAGTV